MKTSAKRPLLMIALLTSACATAANQSDAPAASPTASPASVRAEQRLAATTWTLQSFGDASGDAGGALSPVVEGTTGTLKFGADSRAGGSSGCNSYGGEYKIEGDRLSFGPVVSTKRACADARANRQEQRYFQALESARRFELADERLTLFSGDGRMTLHFVEASSQTSPAAEWTVSEKSVGPVRVGMTVAEAERAMGKKLKVLGAVAPCYYVQPEGGPPGVALMVIGDRVARVDVDNKSIATSVGARVGDSEERIKTLYAGRVEVTPHKYTEGHYLTVTPVDGGYRVLFETDGERVVRYRAGRLPEVWWVESCS